MDFILRRLIADVGRWYDRHYQTGPGAMEAAKQLHIAVLQRIYDPDRFAMCSDMQAERRALLTEVQRTVNKIKELGAGI